ncbi:Ribosomal protein [Dirofilaria immitis]
MSSNQYKNFPPKAIDLLAHMMNMTLNKAEELSRRNQLATETPKRDESSEIIDNNKTSFESGSSSSLKPVLLRTNSSLNEIRPVVTYGSSVEVLSEDITSAKKSRIDYKPIKIQLPKECPNATFSYMMKVRKNAKDIYVPAKIAVTQLQEAGIDISFHLDTQLYPEIPPLHFRIFCPNYGPKQVWLNGKECIH